MAAVAARIQEEDPIQEDETDTVVAKMNVKTPWTRASSPLRRLQASSKILDGKLGQANPLPPHIRGSTSFTSKGTPIILRRPIQELGSGEGTSDNMKANSGAKFKAFKPQNSLNRRVAGHSSHQAINTSLLADSTPKSNANKKRKYNKLAAVSDEEDELAGPGVNDRNSSSPVKRRRASISRQSSVEEYQRVERIVSPPNGLKPRHKTSIGGSFDLPSLSGETEKEKRERKRKQTVLKHQRSQKQQSELASPYFLANAQDLQNEHISSLPKSPVLRNHSTKASPSTKMEGFRGFSGTDDVFFDEHNQNGKEVKGYNAGSPLPKKNRSLTQTTQEHQESSRRRLLRKHEKCWPIKGFFTEKNSYEKGRLELVVDKDTKMLSLRIDDKLQSERFPMSMIFDARFSASLIRLHFRGPIVVIIWIRSIVDAKRLVMELQEIHDFRGKAEHRVEQIFAKWIRQCENRSSSPIKKTVENFPTTPSQPSPNGQAPTLSDHRRALPQRHLVKLEQNEDTPKPKRFKLNERLQAGQNKPQDDSARHTPARNGTRAAATVTNFLSSGSKRPLQLSDASPGYGTVSNTADLLKSSRKDTTGNREYRTHRSSMQPKELSNEGEDSGTALAKHDLPSLTRPVRVTRAKRSYAELDEPEMPSVAKYSKIHGLGPRWTEPLIWPKNGKKRVTVEFDDLERLDEGEFLNDSLVEFALRWLRRETNDPPNIYWFNTYFFEKISKGKGRQIDYNGVKKWTKDVDLFSYDYVIVPINENYHWYLAIICNLPQLKRNSEAKKADNSSKSMTEIAEDSIGLDESADLELLTRSINLTSPKTPLYSDKSSLDGSTGAFGNLNANENDPKLKAPLGTRGRARDPSAPTIVTLDSLGGSHPQAIATLKLYLKEEARERLGISWEKDDIVGKTAKGIPCQNNLSDCGLYLLGYVAKMLPDPADFINKLLLKGFDEEKDWNALEPSHLRMHLRITIQRKHRNQIARASTTSHNKIAADGNSSDLSSDDIQLLEPKNRTLKADGENLMTTPFSLETVKEQYSDRTPAINGVLDGTRSQSCADLPQLKSESHEQVTAHEDITTASDIHPVHIKTHQESDNVQEPFEVPETPQTSPEPELPTRPSTPDIAPSDQADQQLVAQSTSPASSYGSTLRSFLRYS